MRADALEVAAARWFAGDEGARATLRRLVLVALRPDHPQGLAQAKRQAAPGQCIFCEEELHGRSRWICREPGCLTSYATAWQRDMRHSRGQPVRNAHARE